MYIHGPSLSVDVLIYMVNGRTGTIIGVEFSVVFTMVYYIFWPTHLNPNDLLHDDKELYAISISLESGNHLVLDIIPGAIFRKKGFTESILPPYYCVARYHDNEWLLNGAKVWIIRYEAPKLKYMQFLSLEPILLTLPERQENSGLSSESIKKLFDYRKYQVDKARLKNDIDQINLYYKYLSEFRRRYPQLSLYQKQTNNTVVWRFLDLLMESRIYLFCLKICLIITMFICFISSQISRLLNGVMSPFLKISVTIRQVDLRCQQVCYFPVQFLRINKKKVLTESLPNMATSEKDNGLQLPCQFYPDYIRFYNTIWLMVNDISFGLVFGALMFENRCYLVTYLNKGIRYYLYDFIKTVTVGLADNPFGIKLNAELTRFLSELFLWIIDFSYLHIIEPLTEVKTLMWLIEWNCTIMSFVGATFGLSLIVDFLSLCSFHIFLFYHIINKLYSWQLNAMTNLYYLFRGKKKNKLRQRIDFNHFELDQLLMGMLLFIIMVYLTPTVLAFYISYTCLRISLIYVEIILEAVITLINHFPLFALLLRIKDPKRLPGGVSFDLNLTATGSYLILKNNPLKMSMLFKPFTMVLNIILDNYCSIHTLINIIKGRRIIMDRHKLYHVLYSSLPKKPVSVNEVYKQLFDAMHV